MTEEPDDFTILIQRDGVVVLELKAPLSDEPLHGWLSREVREHHPRFASQSEIHVVYGGSVRVRVDEFVTIRQAAEFSEGGPLIVSDQVLPTFAPSSPRGDEQQAAQLRALLSLSLIEVVRAGVTAKRVGDLLLVFLDGRRWGKHRAIAADWRDEDNREASVSDELKRLVCARRSWKRKEFDTAFGLDQDPGTALLKACGYRKVGTGVNAEWLDEDAASDHWQEVAP